MICLKQKNIPNFQQESPFMQLQFLVIQCWQCTQCTENQTPAALTSSATSLLSRVNQHPITPPHKSPECWMIIYLETQFIRVTQYFTPLAVLWKGRVATGYSSIQRVLNWLDLYIMLKSSSSAAKGWCYSGISFITIIKLIHENIW